MSEQYTCAQIAQIDYGLRSTFRVFVKQICDSYQEKGD
jgi:hypothetical protein